MTLWCIEKYKPRAVVMCFGQESADYRVEAYPDYHAARPEMPEDLAWQWERAPALYEALGWKVHGHESLEADDLMGSYATVETEAGGPTLILTAHPHMFQFANEDVTILLPRARPQGPGAGRPRGRRHVPVRERARPDPAPARPPAGPGRGRAGRRARDLRDRPGAGPRLHRAARGPERRPAGRQGHRRQDRGRPAAAQGRPRARDPGRDPRVPLGPQVADRAGSPAAHVPGHRDAARRAVGAPPGRADRPRGRRGGGREARDEPAREAPQ